MTEKFEESRGLKGRKIPAQKFSVLGRAFS